MKCSLFILTITLLFSTVVFSQITVSGTVKGGNEFLLGANIIAKPLTKGAKFAYTIANEKGAYSLKLTPNVSYKFTISFMGFITLKEDVLLTDTNTLKNFFLKEDPNELQEVVIKYREPIKVKKDTTTYRVDAFTTGKERKLRQVLKKLPGVDVDRKGNVTVKGKKVTTVLVENKKFFTGDSKLAVNNIPAEVIDEIQVIEDYHESPLLKGLESSEEVALNINLKEDKKKFIFGNVEVGGGVEDRYVVHPTLFKYSPNTTINFIGDFNNTGDKSFTLRDYMSYDGGFDIENFSSIYDSPIVKLLRNRDFNANKHLFGALNMQWKLNAKNDINAFVIGLQDKIDSRKELNRIYTLDNILENRNTIGSQQQEMMLGSIQLKSAPNKDVRIQFDNKVEISKANDFNTTNSVVSNDVSEFGLNEKVNQFSIKSNFKMEKRFSSFHTSQAKVDLLAENNDENENWISEDNIFLTSLPIQNTSEYSIFQKGSYKKYNSSIQLKHFWIVNPVNHLYFTIKNSLLFNKYKGIAYQELTTNKNSFLNFNNTVENNKAQSSFSTEYKRLLGSAFLTLKLEYLNYNRFNTQLGRNYNRTLNLFLPEVNLKWEIDRKRELNFKYKLSNSFPKMQQLLIGNRIRNFNSIYQGNVNLEESYYHYFKLSFRKYQNYGWSFYPSISYKLRRNIIQNTFISEGVYNVSTPVNSITPMKEVSTNFRVSYNYKYWRAQLFTNYRNNRFSNFLNNESVITENNSAYVRGSFKTVYVKGPNVDISLGQNYNFNRNKFYKNISDRTNFDFNIHHEVSDWQFNGNFLYNYYKNRDTGTKNSFNQIDASIFYQQEGSPWGFELKVENLSNNSFQLSSSISDILFNETKEYVMPRMLVFKVTYKL